VGGLENGRSLRGMGNNCKWRITPEDGKEREKPPKAVKANRVVLQTTDGDGGGEGPTWGVGKKGRCSGTPCSTYKPETKSWQDPRGLLGPKKAGGRSGWVRRNECNDAIGLRGGEKKKLTIKKRQTDRRTSAKRNHIPGRSPTHRNSV